ncbi:MAG: GNAT family N-acetyltransferase [Bacteroidetes bacterium]|nr:GNAT family N-acetyltransferase [Bacteroidota bacterium]
MSNIEFAIESVPASHDIFQYLDDQLYEFNAAAIRKKDGNTFSKIIRDSSNHIIGGVYGWTWASACEILILWVKEEYRKNGLGEKLLQSAEDEAIQKKSNVILIRSYSFQAPAFYEKQGYKTEHILDNFPNGYKLYSLVKRIDHR